MEKKREENDKALRLIYHELPVLLQEILCTAHEEVGYDGIDINYEYIKKYADETIKVANLCINGQLATLEKIIN